MTRPGWPHATGADLLTLHALRCAGFTSLARVADATGLPEPEAESELIDLAVAGLVTKLAGDFGGWGLTAAGRAADAERIADELDAAGTRAIVAAAPGCWTGSPTSTGAPSWPARSCRRRCSGSAATGSGSAVPWLVPAPARWSS